MTKAGATAEVERLNRYWHSRGYPHFQAVVIPLGRLRDVGQAIYGVRSNLGAGGLPPSKPTPVRVPKSDDFEESA